jgi:Mrp family chromosome partitioning ATPase
MIEQPNANSRIGKVIAVVSGKGGVGKSLVSSLLASGMQKKGHHSGVLDADITGPSIPKVFGIHDRAMGSEAGMLPCRSQGGVDIMSVNLLLSGETDPVLWRGPVIAGVVKQFWTETIWEDVDYLFVDMPPGTGDVPLTVFQSLPLDGIIVVTSPQDLVSMIVEKAVKMAALMQVPILGIVENMSYLECPDCGKKISVFGDSHLQEIAENYHLPVLGRIPIDPSIAKACDEGEVETIQPVWLEAAFGTLENLQ